MTFEILGPPPDVLAIIRLHLERLPEMTQEERALFRDVTALLISLPIIVPGVSPDSPAHAATMPFLAVGR